MEERKKGHALTASILSLSSLTVMAGAAVAPALDVIQAYFSDVPSIFVQMVISIPALFIALTNLLFPWLCRHFRTKELLLAALALYTVAGCIAGLFSNIFVVLIFRALVGVAVGVIMPLSTGLLAFYYPPEQQDRLMGYSSAMNQFGGVAATLISAALATVSWRVSFLVYLMGLVSIVLCLLFLPNERIGGAQRERQSGVFRSYFRYIAAMFVLMFVFFVFPSVFAIETAKTGILPRAYSGIVMASMDFIAFLGGLSFVSVKKRLGKNTSLAAPLCFLAGYLLLLFGKTPVIVVAGAWLVGFANGIGIPFLISSASRRAGRAAATTIMPFLSIAMYLAQFFTPMLLSAAELAIGGALPYAAAACGAVLLLLWSGATLRQEN